jgi:hypothetical protein
MAGWEEELSVLLSELGVKQEESHAHLKPTRQPMHSDVKRREQHLDMPLWSDENEISDDDPWIDDLDMMRQEVDSIVGQVVLLLQRGDLSSAVREDVMVVLRALRRRIPMAQQSTANDEAYLESASAMLHFCRLVLQLSEFTNEDF